MRGKIILIFISFLLLASLVSASTTLEIKTLPDHEIFITEIDAFQSENVAVSSPIHTFTGKKGIIEIEYTPEKQTYKLGLILKKDNKRVISYQVLEEIFHDNEMASIEFLPSGMTWEEVSGSIEEEQEEVQETISNKTEETETNTTNETSTETTELETETNESQEDVENNETNKTGVFTGILINGYTTIQENKSLISVASYFIGAVILIVPIYLIFKRRKNKKGLINIVSDKIKKSDDEDDDKDEDVIKKAEEDLKKAKERMKELKGKKIEAAKRKIIEDEKELLRLKNLDKDEDDN